MQVFWYWVVLSAVAYMMYFVAYVFESRVPFRDVPLWKHQSRAFFPGDIGLSLFIAVAAPFQMRSVWLLIGGIVLAVVAFFVVRHVTYSPNSYTKQAWKSPSKLWHDFVVCSVYGFLAVTMCVPFYFSSWSDNWNLKLLGLAGLSVWLIGAAADEMGTNVPSHWQHPTRYWPIWNKPADGPQSW